jgi:glycosyltransferase involved in cell wall biosynthesis
MHNPLITVGIPNYNNAKFIATALDSVVNQTYSNLQIIVVDNNSTDDTDNVLSAFDDPRISVIKVNNNGSIAISRNIIIDKAQGDWIAFLDSDDWWDLNKLNDCSKYFREGVDLIYHDLKVIFENKAKNSEKSIKSRKLRKPVFKDLILNGNTIATSSVVVRSSMLRRVNGMNESKDMFGIEDFNAWLKISQITDNFKHVSKNLGFYRVHDQNNSDSRKFRTPSAAFIEFLPLLTEKELSAMYRNYEFANVRMKFLRSDYAFIQKDLLKLMKKGRLSNRIKVIYMYLIVIIKIMNK